MAAGLTLNRTKILAFRGSLALLALISTYFAVIPTLALSIRTASPDQAIKLAPWDGRIRALAAQRLASPKATKADRAQADMMSRTALRVDPTAVIAVSTLGFSTHLRGDVDTARRIFRYAETLSRRDLPTQLWLIEDAVSRNDIPVALHRYDVALRTSTPMQDVLFPILAAAITEQPIQQALVKTLSGKPLWGPHFISYAGTQGTNLTATARLFAELEAKGLKVVWPAKSSLINRMLAADMAEAAWRQYASVRRGADRRISRDPNFANDPSEPSVFDWIALSDNLVQSSIRPGGNSGIFEYTVSAGVGGPVLQQHQLLPPGDYILEGRSEGIDQPPDSLPYWRLSCSNGREAGRVYLPPSATKNGAFQGRFTVPAGCLRQVLTLMVKSSDAVGGSTGQILTARLYPVK